MKHVAKKLKVARSACNRRALRETTRQANIAALEKKHRKGYERCPAGKMEFSVWESEQKWGEFQNLK